MKQARAVQSNDEVDDLDEQAAHAEVYRIGMAGWGSQVLRSLAVLSVAEALSSGPLTAAAISQRCSSDPEMTYRLLRAATAMGFLVFDRKNAAFAATSKLAVLHADSELSMKHFAMSCGGPAFWPNAFHLPETVRHGSNYVAEELGGGLWDFFVANQEEAFNFQRAITGLSKPVILDAADSIDVGDAKSVVDVGGAMGNFVGELVERHDRLRGVVLDLPNAMPGVQEESERRGLGSRLVGIAGDFFESVPDGDIFLLKFILHDWEDERCVTILRNIRKAMNPGARLFVVEMDIAPDITMEPSVMMDMVMMFTLTGREREAAQYKALFHSAGLTLKRTTLLRHPYLLMEVQAAD